MGDKVSGDKASGDKAWGKEKLEFAGVADKDRVADYFNRLAEGFRVGAVTLTSAGQTVHLVSGDRLRLELEAEARPDKGTASIQLEISWKTARGSNDGPQETLTIEPVRTGSLLRPGAPATDRS